MTYAKPWGLLVFGLCLAVVTPSFTFAFAQSTQTNLAPATSGAFKPLQSAQASPGSAKPTSPATALVTPAPTKPLWQELTAAQQQALKPLGANWATFSEPHKRKWLAVSQNYPTLSPPEQAKLHSRMTEWASMSPQQRNQARLNFAETKKIAPDDKAANWQAYQALSPEEKQKLAAKAPPPQAGATAAVKPVPAQKLANVPATRNTPKSSAVASNTPPPAGVQSNTLLPRNPGGTESAVGKN
jgi:Protein of unknown function (DUF3106)